MSRDWLLVAPLAVGHLGLFVVIINMAHALGFDERRSNQVKIALLSALLAIAALMAREVGRGSWPAWTWPLRAYALLCLGIGLVGIPAVTLARALRRMPDGVTGRASELDLVERDGPEPLIGTGRHAWMIRLPGNESLRLRKLEWEVVLPGLPSSCDGLSLVQLTDLHFAPWYSRRFFEIVAEEAGSWDADLVLLTGDLVEHDDGLAWIAPVLSRVQGRLGSFAILGNHDYALHARRIRRAIRDAGLTDLEGCWTRIAIEGATVALGGTSYPWGPRLDPNEMPEADFRILLSHSPDQLAWAARWGIDLMLSGHNHGGQIRLPLIGPVFMPSLYSRRYDRGFFRAGPTLLHVSQGIGGQHPLRYGGCAPEISRFVLRVAEPVETGRHTPARVADSTFLREHRRVPKITDRRSGRGLD
ncbi:MAG TPA: metallophosphoesterase [Isosphaeraceae bacterium]|nr:metallophosphoesterase [Isosphaeraceae bacterium]